MQQTLDAAWRLTRAALGIDDQCEFAEAAAGAGLFSGLKSTGHADRRSEAAAGVSDPLKGGDSF